MAGFSRAYFVGSTGGFMGADGLARPFVQVLQGEGSRQWLEPVYEDSEMGPIGSVRSLVPTGPDHSLALLDAVIAFCPHAFERCPSFNAVAAQLEGVTKLDFNIGQSVPAEWDSLRREALPIFHQLTIFAADLRPVDVQRIRL
jgi:hypothetical protein